MDADEVPPIPGHEVTAPNDCELHHCGMTEGVPTRRSTGSALRRGHSAGVPVGYHLFEQQAAPGIGPRAVSVPMPAPPAVVSRFTPAPALQPAIQQASGQQPTFIQQPSIQQAYGQQPSGMQAVWQPPLVQLQPEQATTYPQSSLPSNPGLDAPEPVIVPAMPANTANSNSPVSGSGPIRQTTEWSPAPQSTPAPTSAAPQSALTQPAEAHTPAPQTPAPWSSAPWFHARQPQAPQPPAQQRTVPQQPVPQIALPPKPAPKPAATAVRELVGSSDPQFRRGTCGVAGTQSGRRTDDHTGCSSRCCDRCRRSRPSH